MRVQVVVMIHSGSRGLGHQVATDALTAMERAMARDGIHVNDRQLACAHISSQARPGTAFCSLVFLIGHHNRVWRSLLLVMPCPALRSEHGRNPLPFT